MRLTISQVDTLKLNKSIKEDEFQNYQTQLRELSAQSHETETIGKIYHQVMVSRWQIASVYKKYDDCIYDLKKYRKENSEIVDSKDL